MVTPDSFSAARYAAHQFKAGVIETFNRSKIDRQNIFGLRARVSEQNAEDLLALRSENLGLMAGYDIHGNAGHGKTAGAVAQFNLYAHQFLSPVKRSAAIYVRTPDEVKKLKRLIDPSMLVDGEIPPELSAYLSSNGNIDRALKIYDARETRGEATQFHPLQLIYEIEQGKLADFDSPPINPEVCAYLITLKIHTEIARVFEGLSNDGSPGAHANNAIVNMLAQGKNGGWRLHGNEGILHAGQVGEDFPIIQKFETAKSAHEVMEVLRNDPESIEICGIFDDVIRMILKNLYLAGPHEVESAVIQEEDVLDATLAFFLEESMKGGKNPVDVMVETADKIEELMSTTYRDAQNDKARKLRDERVVKTKEKNERISGGIRRFFDAYIFRHAPLWIVAVLGLFFPRHGGGGGNDNSA